jgi:hypothetical protein
MASNRFTISSSLQTTEERDDRYRAMSPTIAQDSNLIIVAWRADAIVIADARHSFTSFLFDMSGRGESVVLVV